MVRKAGYKKLKRLTQQDSWFELKTGLKSGGKSGGDKSGAVDEQEQ